MRFQNAIHVLATSLPATFASSWKPKSFVPRNVNKGARQTFKRETNGITYSVYEHTATNATLDIVEDSGICETTPGVKTYSGYLSVGTNMSMWFWFFEARNNASAAPLALWLNGGPGCSSMIGLFQEHGPCHFVNGSDEPSLNPHSWNTYANMLYVDQPIGTGFSFGDDQATSTVTAAPFVWKFMQAFFEAFPKYESREFGLWTESYGGHYGPEFAGKCRQLLVAGDSTTSWRADRIPRLLPEPKRGHIQWHGYWRGDQTRCPRYQQRVDRPNHPRESLYGFRVQQYLACTHQRHSI